MPEQIREKKFEKEKMYKIYAVIFSAVLLLFSVVARYPREDSVYFDNDAPYHVLLTMQAFEETPASIHKFLPLVSLGGAEDKGIPWGVTVEHEGNYYYTSFSPACFAVPYFFCKLFHLPFTMGGLYIFSSVLYFICTGLGIYLMLKLFSGKLNAVFIILISVFAFGFQPEVLNSLGPVYWAQSLFQVVFLVQLILLQYFEKKWCRVIFYLLCLLAPYIEWTGFISNAGFALVMLMHGGCGIKERHFFIRKESAKKVFLICAMTILAGLLFIIHFLSVLPADTLLDALASRFSARSAAADISFGMLIKMYWKSYNIFIPGLILFTVGVLLFQKTRKSLLVLVKQYYVILFASGIVILENIVLKEHAIVYSYDRMKANIFLTIILFLLFLTVKPVLKLPQIRYVPAVVSVLFAIISGVNLYRYVCTENFYRQTVDYLEDNKTVAAFINENSDSQNTVLLQTNATRGYTNVLFGRGVFEYCTQEDVYGIANARGKRYAVLLEPEHGDWNMYQYSRFTVYDTVENFSMSFEVVNHKIQEALRAQ